MKILVSTPDNYNSKDLATFFEGVSYLKRLGHNVIVDNDLKGKGDEKEFFKKMEKAIKDTDIVLTEASNSDTKTGFEIARSLDEKKIVIVLEEEGKAKGKISWVLGNSTKNLISQKYNKKNIHEVMDIALNEAKGQLDTKFILIISPEIDRYLDWAASTKRMHKAQIVRNAVEGMMKKDKEYKNYLAG